MSELLFKNSDIFKQLNLGSEFTIHTIDSYFPREFCHDKENTDIRKIIDKLKLIENDF
jgi:hypothetical protein